MRLVVLNAARVLIWSFQRPGNDNGIINVVKRSIYISIYKSFTYQLGLFQRINAININTI